MKKTNYLILVLLVGLLCLSSCKKKPTTTTETNLDDTYELYFEKELVKIDRFSNSILIQPITKINGVIVDDAVVLFESSNTSIFRVDDKGLITPTGYGSASLIAKWKNKESKIQIEVITDGKVPSLKTNVDHIGFLLGNEPFKIEPYVYYLGEKYYSQDVELRYEIVDGGENIISVDKNGVITPLSIGSTNIYIHSSFRGYDGAGMSVTIPVTVSYDIELHISLNSDSKDIYKNQFTYLDHEYSNETSFTCSLKKSNESGKMEEVVNPNIEWHVSDSNIATISNDGKLTGLKGGIVNVWASFTDNNIIATSETIEIYVHDYVLFDESNKTYVLLSEDDNYKLPNPNMIFGQGYDGDIIGVYEKEYGNNLLRDNCIDISSISSNNKTIIFESSNGFAYKVSYGIFLKIISINDIEFGLYNKKIDEYTSFSIYLPKLEYIEQLEKEGYKSIRINYNKIEGLTTNSIIRSDFISELNVEIEPNKNGEFDIAICDLISRYSDFAGGRIFYIPANNVKIEFNECSLEKDYLSTNINARLERGASASINGSSLNVLKETQKDGKTIEAQVTYSSIGDSILPVSFISSKLLSKNSLASFINDGYDYIRIYYYLEYDSNKMTSDLYAYTSYGTQIKLKANKWDYIDLDLRAIFAKHKTLISERNNHLFEINANLSDNNEQMDYTFYMSSSEFIKDSDYEKDSINVYSVSGMYFWTAEGDSINIKTDYNKEIDGKVAQISGSLDTTNLPVYGVGISCFWTLDITREMVKKYIDSGYTQMNFEYYLSINQEEKKAYIQTFDYYLDFEAKLDSWGTYSVGLEYIYNNYETLNGAGGYEFLFKINPIDDVTLYKFALGNITLDNGISLTSQSNFYEYCDNPDGPNEGFAPRQEGLVIDGKEAKVTYEKDTRDPEYGTTKLTANFRYNITEEQIQNAISNGYKYIKFELYLGVKDTIKNIESIEMSTLANDSSLKSYPVNKWINVYLDLNDFISIINDGYTFRMWLPTDGAGSTCGKYSMSISNITFESERELSPINLAFDSSTVYENCENAGAPNIGFWAKVNNDTVGNKENVYTFYNTTRNPEYGKTDICAYFKYNVSAIELQNYIDSGYKFLSVDVYLGVSNTVKTIDKILVATLGVNENATYLDVNKWITIKLDLNNLKKVIEDNTFTFRIYPEIMGNGDTCGLYSISIGSLNLE